jgi:Cof subfamily protein (haloacid dehalogenase superfamily)
LVSRSSENSILYISDLDGTLLRDDALLSPFSSKILRELLEDHLPFTVASARSATSIRKVLPGLELQLPVIGYNGSFISDLASGEPQIVNSIGPTTVEEVYELIGASGGSPFISTFDGARERIYYSSVVNNGMQWFAEQHQGDPRMCLVNDWRISSRDQVTRVTVIGQRGILMEVQCAIKSRCNSSVEVDCYENQYSPGWYWLTVHDQTATKDQAIRVMMREWGLEDAELVVFGDGNNDIKMFQMADRAIAVANAADDVKRYASEVIGANSEDSVVKYLLKDWAGAA